MLTSKDQIPNYEKMACVLRENGYETWYHDDYWVHKSYYHMYHGFDNSGNSTEHLYKNILNKKKTGEYIKKKLEQIKNIVKRIYKS